MESHHLLIIAVLFLLRSASAQTPTAPSPGPAGPTNVTKILEKAGQFTTLIRLFKTTQVGDQINTQLNNSDQGLTLFAPDDTAFSALPAGTLNSLSDQQKVSLVQFHVVPNFLSVSQFQTISNPLRTQAGGSGAHEFPMNVTTGGNNQVNVSTGIDDATVGNAVYTDGQLAVYHVDKVLLPMSLFGAPAPAPAPVKGGKKKAATTADSPTAGDAPVDASGGVAARGIWVMAVAALVGVSFIVDGL